MISIIIPSRGRPEKIKQALASIEATTDDYEILLGLDVDDAGRYDVAALYSLCPSAHGFYDFEFPAGLGCSGKVNRLGMKAGGDWIMGAADDLIWHTKGWDRILDTHKPGDGIVCCYCKDDPDVHRGPIASDGVPGIPIVTREFYDVAGFFPKHFFHFYGDTWSTDIARRVDRLVYVDEITIEHMHWRYGKGEFDETAKSRGTPQTQIWKDTEPERVYLANRLRAAIESVEPVRAAS